MSDELSKYEKRKLKIHWHRQRAVKHSLITLGILAVPFFGSQWIFSSDEPPDETRSDDVDYRVSMVGDMMMGRHIEDVAMQSGYINEEGQPVFDHLFEYVRPYFEESDYTTGNFEAAVMDPEDIQTGAGPYVEDPDESGTVVQDGLIGPIGGITAQYIGDVDGEDIIEAGELASKDIHLYSQPSSLDAVISAGFDSINFANNHTMDYGTLSYLETNRHLENRDIESLGIGEDAADAAEMDYFDVADDVRVGVMGQTDSFVRAHFPAGDGIGGVLTSTDMTPAELTNYLNNIKIDNSEDAGSRQEQIEAMDGDEHADIIMTHMHWGDEYQVGYNDDQEEIAHGLVAAGVDVIIGHHSHVLEPISVVRSGGNIGIVINSLGNFVFDQGWTRTKETAIAQLDFLEDGSKELAFVPMDISGGAPRETGGITSIYENFRIFRSLRKELDSNIWDVRDGRLVIDLDEAGVLSEVDHTS
ncbi:CapA family protein [Salisediminibacterium halotolerans]|uniref:Poly-gamma-glutamate synthesis protein (Capsule biosynthesis protein) n=1 Tax=Salisediminibacterium halotolerans TaxID=517425 RepID=A0A1H9SIU3_9BACI|nr:CapA family protein [Salisediminibacterium haloalkalitolerans]SER84966.1 poly-gamma-glutamate synthesis protein (capsule biosynthesis protein) [Salisediminibacterium haloalkalitolerans]